MESTVHTQADHEVARVLRAQFQGRSEPDWDAVASSAINALMSYEDELNRQFLVDHPEVLASVPRVVVEADLRRQIASNIRKIHCHYQGVSAISFGSARELAALTAEGHED